MASSGPAGIMNSKAGVDLGNQCPPEFVVRFAVLKTDELLLSHIAECPKCMGIYAGALDSYGCGKDSRPAALPKGANRAGDWIVKCAASMRGILHPPATIRDGSKPVIGRRAA